MHLGTVFWSTYINSYAFFTHFETCNMICNYKAFYINTFKIYAVAAFLTTRELREYKWYVIKLGFGDL